MKKYHLKQYASLTSVISRAGIKLLNHRLDFALHRAGKCHLTQLFEISALKPLHKIDLLLVFGLKWTPILGQVFK